MMMMTTPRQHRHPNSKAAAAAVAGWWTGRRSRSARRWRRRRCRRATSRWSRATWQRSLRPRRGRSAPTRRHLTGSPRGRAWPRTPMPKTPPRVARRTRPRCATSSRTRRRGWARTTRRWSARTRRGWWAPRCAATPTRRRAPAGSPRPSPPPRGSTAVGSSLLQFAPRPAACPHGTHEHASWLFAPQKNKKTVRVYASVL
ncbi:hypothetical protein HU200_022034 [Digitaria exilis]|uniref:Uncharacterized protein n=1 Tax=Digitaria exilis TaxID=1010633 RepID=A0A835C868_9POAL|nr:hypothetical protein HU200_022034 [Digitaria exilis]